MYSTNTEEKRFQNKICQDCIRKNIAKYGSFEIKCKGITVDEDVKFAMKQGVDEDTAREMFDSAYFFEKHYGHKPRWYQYRLLYCTANKLIARQCRQTGKTLIFMYKVFQYVLTNDNVQVLIFLPTEKQIKTMWDNYLKRDFIYRSQEVEASVAGMAMSPSYEVTFTNGSKITLAIPSASARGFQANWIYIDEAALVPKEALNAVLMTIASKEDYTMFMTSTPFGRGNAFYKECKDSQSTNEYHVSIYEVDEMKNKITFFKDLLGETGFIQECEAEFPDTSGGPFNYKGIDLAKLDYRYEAQGRVPGWIYLGGVDWNGPGIGTYFVILGFNPDTYQVRVFDSRIISSANWNSTVAKEMFRVLNEKWRPKHWMVDAGYGTTIVEDLMLMSVHSPNGTPDGDIKYCLEKVEFGSFTEVEDPFTGEIIKKMTKNLMVSQFAKLFEVRDGGVSFQYSKYHEELTKSLESYKLLSITDKGIEKYGFDKKDDIEDHCYTPDHEFLTRKGWKRVSDIDINDELAAPDKYGVLKYEKPSRIIAKEYTGKIYTADTENISFSVTDKHLIPYLAYNDKKYEFKKALVKDLPKTIQTKSAVSGEYGCQEGQLTNDQCYEIGFKAASGFNYKPFNPYKFGSNSIKEFLELQEARAKATLEGSAISRVALRDASRRQLQIIFSGILNGSGITDSDTSGWISINTKSRELADNIQEICAKIGFRSILTRPSKSSPHYTVKYSKVDYLMSYSRDSIKESEYSGMVYCATVTDGLLVVRRNGRIHIGANCIDSVMVAVHGITKYYSELFKRIAHGSVIFDGKDVLTPANDGGMVKVPHFATITLITNNHSMPIELDEGIIREPEEDKTYISRTFDKSVSRRMSGSLRQKPIVKRVNPFFEANNNDSGFSRRTSFL